MTLDWPWHVRFVETMPFGTGDTARVARDPVPNAGLGSHRGSRRAHAARGATRPTSRANAGRSPRGVIGFISPVSEPYCGTCNRMRLTADGKFHLCLLNDDEVDVRAAIRSGGGIDAVAEILLRAVRHKPTGHRLAVGHTTADRQMFQIGG